MRSVFASDCMVAIKWLVTRGQCVALKGPHEIAQGEALGHASNHVTSPERAKSGSGNWPDLAGRKSSRAMPPFQGWNRMGIGFPGLRPGLSHLAPSGPTIERALNLMPFRFRGNDGKSSAFRDGITALSRGMTISG